MGSSTDDLDVLEEEDHVVPAPELRARLLVSMNHGRPLVTFATRVARLYGMSVGEAKALLGGLADEDAWRPGPVRGFRMADVSPAPKGGTACLLRGSPGATFPRHRHLGPEQVMVLQGGFRELDQTAGEFWTGDDAPKDAGTHHSFVIVNDCDCIAAVLVQGIEFF